MKGIQKQTAPLLVIGAGICWGIIGLFSKQLAALGFSPIQITFGRSLVTAVVMVLTMLCQSPRQLAISWRDSWMFLGTGLCSIVFFNVCYFTAMELTTLSMAAILLYTAPSIVMILSVILFKESFTMRKAICLALSFVGCVFVSGLGIGQLNISGILAGLGAGLGYALYSIFGRYALTKYSPMTVTTWTFCVASAGLTGFSHIQTMVDIFIAVPQGGILFLCLGLVSTALPFILYTTALHYMETGKASILASVEPLTSTIIGVVVFHETMSVWHGCGIACILGAVVLLNTKSS